MQNVIVNNVPKKDVVLHQDEHLLSVCRNVPRLWISHLMVARDIKVYICINPDAGVTPILEFYQTHSASAPPLCLR